MKVYTTTQGQEFTIDYASAITAGYGHQKITAYVNAENGDKKEFSAKTNNMPDFDEATDLEGQEKYEALFDLVDYSLDGEIAEWINEIESFFYIAGYSKGNKIGFISTDGDFTANQHLDNSAKMGFKTEIEASEFIENLPDQELSETFEYRVEKSY